MTMFVRHTVQAENLPEKSENPGHTRGAPGFRGVHRRTVGPAIPRSGCVPAEPASVSPGYPDRKPVRHATQIGAVRCPAHI